ncbi:MAG: sugar transferase [Clostridia bacterium]|nr:sugar transferase [Clostridia bacterium]
MQKTDMKKYRPPTVFRFVKRVFDVFTSLLTIIILSPILLIIAAVILLTDGRPIVFSQRRVGLDGKIFKCLKFRTMRKDTPPYLGKGEIEDPERYITGFGRFLRRTSLDELPQLFNILEGDMSIVGPRPIIAEELNLQRLRKEAGVYDVRPGLTGYAQVMGRNDLDDETKVSYDKYYLDHISIGLDLSIILRTFFVVLLRKGEHEGACVIQPDEDETEHK